MIQFSLKCDQEHRFDSWFQSASAFDKLRASGLVSCAVCGSTDIEKAMMAPQVRASRMAERTGKGALTGPAGPAEQAIAALRKQVEENSEYVGMNFAREARSIHDGEAPERPIHGEARPEDARKLMDDGVPVAPLPFVPGRKSN